MTPKGGSLPREESNGVEISNRDRIIFPIGGQTKGALADYYEAVAPIMLPFAALRPISLVRCPQGRAEKCFYQRHDSGGLGDAVKHVAIREKDGGMADYLYIEDARGLLQCVQMGTIEFHGWGSRINAVESPDRMVFDLDPGEGLSFEDVKEAALVIRDRLSDIGLESFAQLTGGTGLHIVVPLARGHDWETQRDFAGGLARSLSLADPNRFTATMSKAERRGRIFIDWFRNQRGNTAILPYSARAREGAPVATPVAWDEMNEIVSSSAFTIDDAELLIERSKGRSISGWGLARQHLPEP